MCSAYIKSCQKLLILYCLIFVITPTQTVKNIVKESFRHFFASFYAFCLNKEGIVEFTHSSTRRIEQQYDCLACSDIIIKTLSGMIAFTLIHLYFFLSHVYVSIHIYVSMHVSVFTYMYESLSMFPCVLSWLIQCA